MPSEATSQHGLDEQQLLAVLKAIKNGDFTKLMPDGQGGTASEIVGTVNDLVLMLNQFSAEVTRISREIGTAGKFGGQAEVPDAAGTWKDVITNVNIMAANLTHQVRDISHALRAAAAGNYSKRVTVPCEGETIEVKESLNTLLDATHNKSAA